MRRTERSPCEPYTKNSGVRTKSHISLLTWNHIKTDFEVLSYNDSRELNLMYYSDHAPFSRASQQYNSTAVIKREVNSRVFIPSWISLMCSLSVLSNTLRLWHAAANVQPHIHQSFLERFKPNHEIIDLELKPLPRVSAR